MGCLSTLISLKFKNQTVKDQFGVEEKYEEIIKGCLLGGPEKLILKREGGEIKLTQVQVSQIRWEVVSFLNMLEGVMAAWRHNVADRDIIEEEFQYLVSPEKDHYILKDFRIVAGGKDVFPAIQEFVEKLEKKSTFKSGKGKIA